MSNTITINTSISIGLVGCKRMEELAFDREEWEAMTEEERDDAVRDHVMQYIDWSFEVAE